MKRRNNGTGLENTVYEIYKDLGYADVRKNLHFYQRDGYRIDAQIDLAYKDILGNTVYVECKSHGKSKNTKLEEFSRFAAVLDLLKIPKRPFLYRGELVTDSYFDNRTRKAAEIERIKLIDRDGLKELARRTGQGFRIIGSVLNAWETYEKHGLYHALKYLTRKTLPIDDRIRMNSR